jgi:hypothetical protein
LIEIAKGENQRPDIYVRPQQDNNYQRTPEQLEYFRNIITERFPHITDLDDQWFEEMRNDLYKFEYIISGSPDLWINAIKTREHLEKSLSMSKEQIRELIIQQKIN